MIIRTIHNTRRNIVCDGGVNVFALLLRRICLRFVLVYTRYTIIYLFSTYDLLLLSPLTKYLAGH